MTKSKALAVQCLLLTGAVVRIELCKAKKDDPDAWWLGHLDTIAELLRPSDLCRRAFRRLDPLERVQWFATDDYL